MLFLQLVIVGVCRGLMTITRLTCANITNIGGEWSQTIGIHRSADHLRDLSNCPARSAVKMRQYYALLQCVPKEKETLHGNNKGKAMNISSVSMANVM